MVWPNFSLIGAHFEVGGYAVIPGGGVYYKLSLVNKIIASTLFTFFMIINFENIMFPAYTVEKITMSNVIPNILPYVSRQ